MEKDKKSFLFERTDKGTNTVVTVGDVPIGDGRLVLMAGPCSVESEEQIRVTAEAVCKAGANILRGGAFKPRTSPYSFAGLGEKALELLRKAADEQGMPCVTEVLDAGDVALVANYAHMLQVGARSMQNFKLLAAVGRQGLPVLLKRGMGATQDEWLLAAEHIMAAGNHEVVLCERGIRTFEPSSDVSLDLGGLVPLRRRTHLPVIVDPSHAATDPATVGLLARCAAAAGVDGLIIEVHPDPLHARSDGQRALKPEGFSTLVSQVLSVFDSAGGKFLG